MTILNAISLESNKKIKINFNGGDLSSDGGPLLIKEFAAKIGLLKLVKKFFKTNDQANSRTHTDPDNLMQVVYQIIAAYFEDSRKAKTALIFLLSAATLRWSTPTDCVSMPLHTTCSIGSDDWHYR